MLRSIRQITVGAHDADGFADLLPPAQARQTPGLFLLGRTGRNGDDDAIAATCVQGDRAGGTVEGIGRVSGKDHQCLAAAT